MQHKTIIFAFLVVLTTQRNYSQDRQLKLDKESFLLGTLSDYMGRIVISNQNDKIDVYDNPMAETITSLFKAEYADYRTEVNEDPRYHFKTTTIYSEKLSKKINLNYTFEKFALTHPKKDTVFYGKLKENLFQTELQKISFIVGLYSQSGVENETRYCIRLSNSARKFAEAEKALKELKCKNVEVEIKKNIPTQFILYFEPSATLKKYLKEYRFLRKDMQKEADKRFKLLTTKKR